VRVGDTCKRFWLWRGRIQRDWEQVWNRRTREASWLWGEENAADPRWARKSLDVPSELTLHERPTKVPDPVALQQTLMVSRRFKCRDLSGAISGKGGGSGGGDDTSRTQEKIHGSVKLSLLGVKAIERMPSLFLVVDGKEGCSSLLRRCSATGSSGRNPHVGGGWLFKKGLDLEFFSLCRNRDPSNDCRTNKHGGESETRHCFAATMSWRQREIYVAEGPREILTMVAAETNYGSEAEARASQFYRLTGPFIAPEQVTMETSQPWV